MLTRRQVIGAGVGAAVAAAIPSAWARRFHGGTISAPPSGSTVGINVSASSYYATQQGCLNLINGGAFSYPFSGWSTWNGSGADTGEEAYLQLDSNGYATSLTASPTPSGGQKFTQLQTAMNYGLPTSPGASGPYPSGTYRLKFQGACTLVLGGDIESGSLSTSSTNVSVSGLTITSTMTSDQTGIVTFSIPTATTAGVTLRITALSSDTNYFRAASIVQSTYTDLYDGGQVWHPLFISALQAMNLASVRTMDMQSTNIWLQGGQYGAGFTCNFTANPSSGDTSGTLTEAFPNPGGAYLITMQSGETVSATFMTGSTAVSFGSALTKNCTDVYFWIATFGTWAQRTPSDACCWSVYAGPPYEALCQLANLLSCDLWCQVPLTFGTDDWSSLATLIKENLSSSVKWRPEISNEVWNSGFTALTFVIAKSNFTWGSSDYGAGYYGMQVALMADEIASVYGDPGFDSQVVVSMGGQAANTAFVTGALESSAWESTPPWQRTSPSGQKTIKAIHIAPYFGQGNIPSADFTFLTSQEDGGYTDFFACLTANPVGGHTFSDGENDLPAGGWIGEATDWVASNVSAMASYGNLPVIGYEGGWQFTANGSGGGQETFQVTAHRDSRMISAYETYLTNCAAAGMVMQMPYEFCYPASTYQWGAIESVMQPISPLSDAPAVYQGIVDYIG